MNPDTGKFEQLTESQIEGMTQLVRPDGSPVPKTWKVFEHGETVAVKGTDFVVAHIGEAYIVLEPCQSSDPRSPEDQMKSRMEEMLGQLKG